MVAVVSLGWLSRLEAALLAARRNQELVDPSAMDEAIDRVLEDVAGISGYHQGLPIKFAEIA